MKKMEEIRILFQNSRFFISFKSRCDGRELKVIKEIENTTQDSRKFYKNPCETILMINDKVPDFIPNQPYFFALESDTIIEIQSYGNSKKKVASFESNQIKYFSRDIFERRQDFKGSKIITNKGQPFSFHITNSGNLLGRSGEILGLVKEKFNFSIEWYNGPHVYGAKPENNGKWTGYIGALMNGSLDFSSSFMAATGYRIEVVSPGFSLTSNNVMVIFKRVQSNETNLLAIFEIFSIELWTIIATSALAFIIFLMQGRPKEIQTATYNVAKGSIHKPRGQFWGSIVQPFKTHSSQT